MVVSFSTKSLSLVSLSPKRKTLQPPLRLHFSSASFSSRSAIRPLFFTNRIPLRHLSLSAPPGSGTTLLEEKLKAQPEDNEADSSTEVAFEVKQVKKGSTEQQWSVVRTTGVVLVVIAGSAAALLSVNALQAALLDKVFDGRIRIQDFF